MHNSFGQVKMQFPVNNADVQKLPFYIFNIGSMEYQHPCYRPVGLVDYQFLYCTSGSGHLIVEDKHYTISAGMGMYFRPNIIHEYYAEKEPWTTHWILFNGPGVDMIPSITLLGDLYIFHIYSMDKLTQLHDKVYTSAEINGLLNINEVSVYLYQFLLEISSCIGSLPNKNQNLRMKQLADVVTYIETNYSQIITLDELANIAGISPQHLCRLFKSTYHMRPVEYITQYRIKHAKHLLTSQEDLTLKEIAGEIGFNDLSYFCTMFKKIEGMTPVEFKKTHFHN